MRKWEGDTEIVEAEEEWMGILSSQFDWHCHHDRLVEPRVGTREGRIAHIEQFKPLEEWETRKRLYQPVKGKLPPEVIKAWEAYDKATEAYDKAWKAYDKARVAYYRQEVRVAYHRAAEAYDKALDDHKDEIEALHKLECPNCPWDGRSIFPEEG